MDERDPQKLDLPVEAAATQAVSPEQAALPYSQNDQPQIEGIRDVVASKTSIAGVDADDSRILKYLEESLPDSEKRIETPMNENCKACVVIPAYGERGYIFRPLLSLAQQKNVSTDEYELIVVVNNPSEEPKQTLRETASDYQRKLTHYKTAIDENQAVINLIKRINGEEVSVATTPEEDQMIETIKASGLKVHVIDKASTGETLPIKEANVGGARNRGVAEAVARFCTLKRDGIIGQSDADTRFDENYVRNLIDAFNSNLSIVGIAGTLEFEEEETDDNELIRLITDSGEISYMHDRLFEILSKKEFKEERDVTEGDNDADTDAGADVPDWEVHFSGANMASRAYVAALAGGVQKIAGGEDPAFGQAVSKFGKIVTNKKIITRPANRFSPRTDVDAGHGQRLIKQFEKLSAGGEIKLKPYKRVRAEKELTQKMGIAIATKNVGVENLKLVLSYSGEALLSDGEISELSVSLSQIDDISEVERLTVENPRLNELKNKALGGLDKLFPDLSLPDACTEIEEVFFAQTNKREAYEHEVEDSWLDLKRYKFIISFFENVDLGEEVATKEIFLDRLRTYNPATYEELSSGPTTWDGSLFVGEMFELTKQGTHKKVLLANAKNRFKVLSKLAESPLADQVLKFSAMKKVLSAK